jgi:hypothetical protein
MLSGQRALIFLKGMGARVKESHRMDATNKVVCYQLANSENKVQIFFDAKTSKKCRFKVDCEIPHNILGISEIELIEQYSTALNRVKINTIYNIFQCYLDDETALNSLIEYFEK